MRRPDYITINGGAGVGEVGFSASMTVDRFGQIHENFSLEAGVSSGPLSTSISAGWLTHEVGTREALNKALDAAGGHISIGDGIGGSIVANGEDIQAYEVGFFTPQVDVGVGYQINYMTLFKQLLDEYSKEYGPTKRRFDSVNHVNPINPIDPIVLDLSKNGIQTTGMNGSVHFDYDGNGFPENTGWVTGGAGFLVMDRDQDGSINDGKELFGDQTVLANGKKAINGFQVLAEFDDNHDGKIDSNDAGWNKLHVWIDNGNGVNSQDEMKTLDELGIKSLNLKNTMLNTVDEQGNTKAYSGTFEWNDGTVSEMSNYLFKTDTINTVAKETIEISEEIADMPYLPGSGNVYNSWDIMAKETDGKLKGLLDSYAAEPNKAARDNLLDQILYTMTGSFAVDVSSRGSNINAKHLAVLEKIYGTGFNNGSNPNSLAGPMLEALYGNVKKYYAGWLDMQTVEKDLFDSVSFKLNESGTAVSLDFDGVKSILQSRIDQDYEKGKSDLSIFVNSAFAIGFQEKNEFTDFCKIFTDQSDDLALVIYSAGRNIQKGGTGSDTLYSQGYDEILLGGAGNDRLEAHGGNNVLSGGTGEDELYGCKGASEYRWGKGANNGNVIFLWNRGDGNDTIINAIEPNHSSTSGSAK